MFYWFWTKVCTMCNWNFHKFPEIFSKLICLLLKPWQINNQFRTFYFFPAWLPWVTLHDHLHHCYVQPVFFLYNWQGKLSACEQVLVSFHIRLCLLISAQNTVFFQAWRATENQVMEIDDKLFIYEHSSQVF